MASTSNPSNEDDYMENQNSNTTSTLFEEDDGPIAIRDWPKGCHPIAKKQISKTTRRIAIKEEDNGPVAIRDWPEGCHPITKK